MMEYDLSREIVSPFDSDVLHYIEDGSNGDYMAAIQNDRRFEVFRHLSDFCSGLFAWYDFRPGSSLLEIGAGFGVLTGMFCARCGKVTAIESSPLRARAITKRYPDAGNLTVMVGNVESLDGAEKFDYIVTSEDFETAGNGSGDLSVYAGYIKMLRARLNPGGTILLIATNKFGIKYFCGEAEPHAGRPFAGISGKMSGANGRSFSREELIRVFKMAGAKIKFYYPLPDHIVPQLIYTDKYQPDDNLRERLLVYHPDNSTLLANEFSLYGDIAKNSVLPFFSNSFIVECGDNFSRAVYAAISIDRGRGKALSTVIYDDDMVRKTPIFPAGIEYAKHIVTRTKTLSMRGIPMLAQEWDGKSIVMPYVKCEMLSSYLKHCVQENRDEFLEIFDKLWGFILASSDIVSSEKNAFPQMGDVDFGPILRYASLELIPLNCFYDGKEFLFFDQEYERENYPAKYVLFRAIHYTYVFSPETEKYVPITEMKERYRLGALWQLFVTEENEHFLPKVRQKSLYKQFYRWQKIDEKQMERNALLLGLDEECSPDYVVSEKMKKIWEISLDLLREFTEVCRKHNLTYYIFFGTLLGAVRHEGFIPWDDDVDVVMPRADFDKLERLASVFREPYFLQTAENDPNIFFGAGMRLRNSNTTGISRQDFGKEANLGIWMDIIALDNCPSNKIEVEKRVKWINFWSSLLGAKVYGGQARILPWGLRQISKYVLNFVSHEWLCQKYREAIRAARVKISDYVSTPGSTTRIYEKEFFGKGVLLRFGNLRVNAPENYKACLRLTAGRDYMKFPPLSERKPHHLGIFNPDVPYTRYHEIFCGLFEGAKDKTIILFGGGFMFEDYMKKYGRSFPPSFIVDNDQQKWGTKRRGVPIREPEAILDTPAKRRHLIICSIHYREIEKQLSMMDIHDYKIYVQEKKWIFADEERGR